MQFAVVSPDALPNLVSVLTTVSQARANANTKCTARRTESKNKTRERSSSAHLPAGHSEGADTPAPHQLPLGQSTTHGVGRVTSGEYLPASHGLHTPAFPTLYVPGEHAVTLALVDPAGHA